MEPRLYFCVLCPEGAEWVGDYDPGDLFGECPSCHSGVGIFEVEENGFPMNPQSRERIEKIIKDGSWARLEDK